MDLAFTPEEQKFADEVRAFVKANLPADVRDKVKNGKHLGRDDYMRWQQALGKKGWLVYTWPKKHGGPGFTPAQRYIFENICAEEYAPGIIPFGTKMVGPVIYTFGNDEQKARYLPAIRESTVWWCQGYSEPGSGSDLAVAAHQGGEGGRPLHRQRLEDLEHDGPLGRLDLLPGAHRSQGQAAGGHLLPADRHEDAGHHREADHHGRRRPRGERGVLRQRQGSGRQPRRQGERGLDLRQVPAGQRAAGHRRRAAVQARRRGAEGHRPRRAGQRQAADREPELRREDRRSGDPGDGARIHRAARAVADGAWRPARARKCRA